MPRTADCASRLTPTSLAVRSPVCWADRTRTASASRLTACSMGSLNRRPRSLRRERPNRTSPIPTFPKPETRSEHSWLTTRFHLYFSSRNRHFRMRHRPHRPSRGRQKHTAKSEIPPLRGCSLGTFPLQQKPFRERAPLWRELRDGGVQVRTKLLYGVTDVPAFVDLP